MPRLFRRLPLRLSLVALLGLAGLALATAPPPAKLPPVPADHARRWPGGSTCSKRVRADPVDHCLKCHGGDKTKGGFDLTTREALLKGGDKAPPSSPATAKASRLYRIVAHLEKPRMPPKAAQAAPDDALAQLADWIDAGAPYDRPLVDQPERRKPKALVVTDEDRKFWSFRR